MGFITFNWDQPDIHRQVEDELRRRSRFVQTIPARAVERGAALLTRMVRAKIQDKGLQVSRTMLRSVGYVIERINDELIQARVGFPIGIRYPRYLEEGTGLYGPLKQLIRPRTKKALAWGQRIVLPGGRSGREFVRRSVKGIRPTRFFSEAVTAFLPRYIEIIDQETMRSAGGESE